jgi:hypothetical protein
VDGILFNKAPTYAFFPERVRLMGRAIDGLAPATLRNSDPDQLAEEVAGRHRLEPLTIDEAGITFESREFVARPGESGFARPALSVSFFLPFAGEPALWSVAPQSPSPKPGPIAGCVREGEEPSVEFTYKKDDPDPALFKRDFEVDLAAVRFALADLNASVASYNDSLKGLALARILARRKIASDQYWEQELGFPRRPERPPPPG